MEMATAMIMFFLVRSFLAVRIRICASRYRKPPRITPSLMRAMFSTNIMTTHSSTVFQRTFSFSGRASSSCPAAALAASSRQTASSCVSFVTIRISDTTVPAAPMI